MYPYYILLFVIIVCIFREYRLTTNTQKRYNLILALIPVFILDAFKSYEIGSDSIRYYNAYKVLAQYHSLDALQGYDRVEVGYKIYISILSYIFPDSQYLFIVSSLIVCIALYYFITRTATNWSLALFFFVSMGFFQFAMSGIRQTIAICILLFSYEFIIRRKIVYFALMIIFALQFHKSSIVFAPVFYLSAMNIRLLNMPIMFLGAYLMFMFTDTLMLFAANTMDYNYGIEETGNGYIFFFVVLLINILVVFSINRLLYLKYTNKYMININFISLLMWSIRLVSRTAERVSLYFMPYTYIALEEYISSQPKKRRLYFTVVAIILTSYICLRRLSRDDDFNNFKFFFQ